MFGTHFYHETLRKLVIAFGSLFNNIEIARYDENRNITQFITVPINYGPKEKYYARLIQDPDLQKGTSITLPRLSFEYRNFSYAGARHLAKTRKRCGPSDDIGVRSSYFNPVPFDIDFDLVAYTKYQEDGNQIVEQLLPYFTPEFTMDIILNEELDITDSVPVVFGGINLQDSYDGDFKDRRVLMWTFNYKMKVNFYGHIKETPNIRDIHTDILVPNEPLCSEEVRARTPRIMRKTITPDPIDAKPGDDFGYTEVVEYFDDGKKFDPITGEDIEVEENE